ncbi:Hypothetical predicted protein [Mytilus galloprovincialis]|uniref:WSC domain-containing protein n=2 Tax=Mytilus galloprovincialis TaxID=29158 RepID=A0A8B6H2L6_MYTGA|nr:Hypothetical predicted protein [Mytilus galloprovincialis]
MGDGRKGLNYMYTGCFKRNISMLGLRRNYEKPQLYMSPFACIKYCRKREQSQFVGITSGNVCSCGYNRYIVDANGPFKVNDTECDINCYGHEVEKCGGNSTFSIYDIVANTTRSSMPQPRQITTLPARMNTANEGVIAGVSVGLTLLVILAILIVLIIKRSRSNAKICLQSCSNTNESVRYENIPQSTQGVTSPYVSLTIANDCQTYEDLMPTGGTYENTTTMSTNYKQSTQEKKHKKRRRKKTNKMI